MADNNNNVLPLGEYRCSKCKQVKPLTDFWKRSSRKRGHHYNCIECQKAYYKSPRGRELANKHTREFIAKMKREQPEEWKRRCDHQNLRKNYGISLEKYKELEKAQQGRCAICGELPTKGRGKRLHVDHDHESGKIRSLLCNLCNIGLGAFRERVDILQKAISYLT